MITWIKDYLPYFQLVISVLLIAVVLLQTRGAGVGGIFGGGDDVYRAKRGIERLFFYLTVVLAILFVGSAIASIVLNKA